MFGEELSKLMRIKDLEQTKYHRLTIIREYKSEYPSGSPIRRVECLCDCGNITNPTKEKVTKGETKSCGCLKEELKKSFNSHNKLHAGESAKNQVFQVYKKSARRRDYNFTLTKDEFLEIIIQPCIYCGGSLGNTLDRGFSSGGFNYTGIDRYTNKLGYTPDNSVPCCRVCNRIKTDMGIDAMYDHINKMIDNSHLWRTA